MERLKQWQIQRDFKKQQEAAKKKKPFLSVVKRGVFLDKLKSEGNKKTSIKIAGAKIATSTPAAGIVNPFNF